MLRPILLAQVVFAFLATVHAAPVDMDLVNRAALQGATSVQTTQTTQTVQGLMTQTCTITLTPITDAQGNPAVEEVQTCTVAMSNGTGGGQNTGNPSVAPNNGGSSSSNSSGTTSSGGGGLAGSVVGTSSVAASAIQTFSLDGSGGSATSTSTGSAASSTSTGSSGGGTSSIAASNLPTDAANAAAATNSAAAANASAAPAAAFTLPGKKLSVLPIGLGVFAGISVIALIVVGLVTYERTKYRKAFRQRKLAEAGSAMGYGGMAQRT